MDVEKMENALVLIRILNELDLRTVIHQIEEIKRIHGELKDIAATIQITKTICEKLKGCSKNYFCCC